MFEPRYRIVRAPDGGFRGERMGWWRRWRPFTASCSTYYQAEIAVYTNARDNWINVEDATE